MSVLSYLVSPKINHKRLSVPIIISWNKSSLLGNFFIYIFNYNVHVIMFKMIEAYMLNMGLSLFAGRHQIKIHMWMHCEGTLVYMVT